MTSSYIPTPADAAEAMHIVSRNRDGGALFGTLAGAGLGWLSYTTALSYLGTVAGTSGTLLAGAIAAVGAPALAIGAGIAVGAALLWAGSAIGKAIGFGKANAMLEDRAIEASARTTEKSRTPSMSKERAAALETPAPARTQEIRNASHDVGRAPENDPEAPIQQTGFLAKELERAKMRQESLAQAAAEGRSI